jgi:hypothetical protein
MADNVSIKELAKRLSINPSTVSRLIERYGSQLGISLQKGRGNAWNAKWMHYLSREDADRLVAFYESQGGRRDEQASESAFQAFGVFYVIQLIPEALPNRLKIGYTDNLEQRLADHRTAAPTARVLASWPCKRSWDYAAMDSITREGCAWVDNEVFEGDPDGFVRRGNEFFALMPKADSERKLSEHSPHKKGDDP